MSTVMSVLADQLEIEMNESFRIEGLDINFYLTYDGLYDQDGNYYSRMLVDLMFGRQSVQKPILSVREKEYLENILGPYSHEDYDDATIMLGLHKDIKALIINLGSSECIVPLFENVNLNFDKLKPRHEYSLLDLGLFFYG